MTGCSITSSLPFSRSNDNDNDDNDGGDDNFWLSRFGPDGPSRFWIHYETMNLSEILDDSSDVGSADRKASACTGQQITEKHG
jgi:hypothetical protein